MDDILVVRLQAENALNDIDIFFTMKHGSIVDPDCYLVAKACRMVFPNGVVSFSMSYRKYIQTAV